MESFFEAGDSKRLFGHVSNPRILIQAPAGTGKTWTSWQCTYLVASKGRPVLTIFVQKLAIFLRGLKTKKEIPATLKFFVEFYIRHTVKSRSVRAMLLQALRMRTLVIIVDGIDEAADLVKDMVDALFLLFEQGHPCVVTSRPEAVTQHLDRFEKAAVQIITLKPLTEEQQQTAIRSQLKGDEFYENVCAFSNLRTTLDRLYEKNPAEDKEAIENITAPDLLNVPGTKTPDPARRQQNEQGRLLAYSETKEPKCEYLKRLTYSEHKEPKSEYLKRLRSDSKENEKSVKMVGELLEKADELVKELRKGQTVTNELTSALCTELEGLQRRYKAGDTDSTVQKFWVLVVSHCDELFVVAERVKEPIKKGVEELCRKFSIDPEECLRFGPMKHPVRVLQKAWSDYSGRFSDGSEVPCTACVMDIVRCQVFCLTLHELQLFLKEVVSSPSGWLWVIRLKNKFILKELTATHFRHVLMNMLAFCCGSCGALWDEKKEQTEHKPCCQSAVKTEHYFEVQVHLKDVYEAEDKGPTNEAEHYGHDLYEYFRVQSGLKVGKQLDFILEKQMTLLEVVGGTPVLMSLLVVVLGRTDHKLPESLYELYQLAIEWSVKTFVDGHPGLGISEQEVYKKAGEVAYSCHAECTEGKGTRVFSHKMAQEACGGMWEEMCGTGDNTAVVLSIIKVIEQKSSYQFSHLSFQEFLFVDQLLRKWRKFRENKGTA